MSATLREIVDGATRLVGQVDGVGVQTYGDDEMLEAATRCFNLIVKKYGWEQYREWSQHTLAGADGVVNAAAFTTVRDFEDFLAVYIGGTSREVPVLPKNINPYTLTGTSVLYWTSLPVTSALFATRRLQFWPLAATGTVDVQSRVYPEEMDWDTVVYLDKDMLEYGTAFMALVGDDLNPNAANTYKDLMESRFQDIIEALGARPRRIGGSGSLVNEWS